MNRGVVDVTETNVTTATTPQNSHNVSTPRRRSSFGFIAIGVVILLFVSGTVAVISRANEHRALVADTNQLAIPSVSVIQAKGERASEELILPATVQAYIESPIFARTNGYLQKWYQDIGSRVNKGQLLADIDTPEIDQELLQARAAREQVAAQLQLAKVSSDRWANLRKSDSVSQQEADQQSSGYTQAQANLAAADANVRRLEQLESFKHIYVPFTGVLTKRNIDVGALVNSGNGGANREMFDVAQIDPLRVYVSVPQTYAADIHRGQKAHLELNEFPGQKFEGTVVRTAESIDPATRTLLTEIDVPNKQGNILPGAYAQVHFGVQVSGTHLTIPGNALLFRSEGPTAAVVGSDSHVHLSVVTIGRDYGTTVEILSGVSDNERIVLNPPDSLEEGEQVQVATQPQSGGHS
jgi:multidrug efflux system membrane fusion protein